MRPTMMQFEHGHLELHDPFRPQCSCKVHWWPLFLNHIVKLIGVPLLSNLFGYSSHREAHHVAPLYVSYRLGICCDDTGSSRELLWAEGWELWVAGQIYIRCRQWLNCSNHEIIQNSFMMRPNRILIHLCKGQKQGRKMKVYVQADSSKQVGACHVGKRSSKIVYVAAC